MQIDLSRGRRFWPGVVAGLLAFGFGSPGLAQKAPDPEAAGRVALEMHRSLQAMDDGVLSMSRDRWDPQYVADQVGPEPAALVAWMRDNMLWTPYAGALRGPEGALMDRRVNSLDGALLLARLLELAGHEARIGTADLDAASIAQLLETAGAQAEMPAPLPAEATEAEPSLAETAELYEIPPETVARGLDPSAATAAEARRALLEAVGTQTQALLERLPRPRPAADNAARIRAGLARHYWAQYRRGGHWVDADWMAPSGKAPVQAAVSFAPSQIPEDLLHRVRVGLVIEQVKHGRAEEQTLFTQEYRPARGEGRKLTLTHMPMDWPADWPATTAADIQTRLRAAFATQKEWWPMLAADGESIGPVSVRADGDINPDPKPNTNPFLPIGVSLAGEMLKVADALRLGDEGSAETLAEGLGPKPQGEWTAEWLEFVLEAPGAAPRTLRRAVFDLIGPAARARGEAGAFKIDDAARAQRALRAMSEIEVAVLPAAPPPEYLLYQGAKAVLANRPVLDEIAADPFGKVPANIMDLMGRMQPLPGALEGFAAARLAANPFAEAVYQDRPLVVARHNDYQREAASGDFLAVQAMDIVDAGVGVDPYADADPFLVRLAQGVADANAEALVLGGEPKGNAAATLAASRPEDWVLLKPGDKLPSLPEGLAASVAAALAAGQMVLCPTGDLAKSGAWWRIDPETGETLAMGPNGWGTSLVEYAFVLVVKTLWAQIACMAITASGGAIGQAFTKGKVALPKTLQEAKDGTRDLANSCVQQTLFSSLTGISTVYVLSKLGPEGRRQMGGLPGAPPAFGHLTASSGATGGKAGGTGRPGQSTGGKGGAGAGKSGGGKGSRGGPPLAGQAAGGQGPGISPKASTVPPTQGNAPNKGGPTPTGYQAAHAAAAAAQERAYAAKAKANAAPTPENKAAADDAWKALMNANHDRIGAWDGPDGSIAPSLPTLSLPNSGPAATPGAGGMSGGGAISGPGGQSGGPGAGGPVDPFGKTVASPDPFGKTAASPDPFGKTAASPDPFGKTAASPDPFGKTQAVPPEGSKGFATTLTGLGGLTGALGGKP